MAVRKRRVEAPTRPGVIALIDGIVRGWDIRWKWTALVIGELPDGTFFGEVTEEEVIRSP